jgi:hypothetical protein
MLSLSAFRCPHFVVNNPTRFRPAAKSGQRSADGVQADGEGFEPSVGCPTLVFKTSALGRSAIPPRVAVSLGALGLYHKEGSLGKAAWIHKHGFHKLGILAEVSKAKAFFG